MRDELDERLIEWTFNGLLDLSMHITSLGSSFSRVTTEFTGCTFLGTKYKAESA